MARSTEKTLMITSQLVFSKVTRSESVRSHVTPHAWAPSLEVRRPEVAAAEEAGVADAVRDRNRAHAVLASAAAKCDPPSAGWNSPTWVGSLAVGQLETTHHRRAARSRHQLLSDTA